MIGTVHATNCKRHPIYCQIISNYKKAIKLRLMHKMPSKKRAMKISNYIYKYSRKYNVNAKIYTAIIAQESLYQLHVKNCKTGMIEKSTHEIQKERKRCFDVYSKSVNDFIDTSHYIDKQESDKKMKDFERACDECLNKIDKYRRERICFDFGISEINFRTARRYNLDIHRLMTDLEYSIESGLRILADFQKRWFKKEPIDWWSRYNSPTRENRDIYEEQVKRWL